MYAFNRRNSQGKQYYIMELLGGRTEIRTVKNTKRIVVNHDIQKVNQGWYDWTMKGMSIQAAFSFLRPEEREFILTGLTATEWDELFKEDDKEMK